MRFPVLPSPAASIQPTGPCTNDHETFLRFQRLTVQAWGRGVPRTAKFLKDEETVPNCKCINMRKCFSNKGASYIGCKGCITFAKCSTKGDSGTSVEEQNGSIASATDRTAYSCSAKSLVNGQVIPLMQDPSHHLRFC
jgi:hypothetical protein